MRSFLLAVGCYWYGLVLVALIWSTSIEHIREIISGTTLMPYLLVWFVLMIPGIVCLYLAQNMRPATATRH